MQDLLQGRLSFDDLKTLVEFDIEHFVGSSYRPTGSVYSTIDVDMFPNTNTKSDGKNKQLSKIILSYDCESEVIDLTNFENHDSEKSQIIDLTPLKNQSTKRTFSGTSSASTKDPVNTTMHQNEALDLISFDNQNSKTKFVMPKPGVNGAILGALKGKRFVLTGG